MKLMLQVILTFYEIKCQCSPRVGAAVRWCIGRSFKYSNFDLEISNVNARVSLGSWLMKQSSLHTEPLHLFSSL